MIDSKIVFAPLLILLSNIFAPVSWLRNKLFDLGLIRTFRSALPVICVGNCTVGGSGKTPLVREITKRLRDLGYSPVVLSRGYGGSIVGPYQVGISDSAAQVGDEPAFLALDPLMKIVISRSRVSGAQFIEKNNLGDIIILDDGYQHRFLERSLNILCFNVASAHAQSQILQERFIPWGIFRESFASAIKRADLVVLSFRNMRPKIEELDQRFIKRLPIGLPVLYSSIRSAQVVSVENKRVLKPQLVQTLCAIANPEGFLLTLEQLGFRVENSLCLPDHSSNVELQCRAMLESSSLPIVVTEKDLIKIPPEVRQSGQVYVLEIELSLEPEKVFDEMLRAVSI